MRGTIGGVVGENLTVIDVVEMVSAYATWIIGKGHNRKVVIGRDGRISGQAIAEITINTLLMMGLDVVDLDLSTTPTVEMEVVDCQAGGGIIITASHNPMNWNALKFLNHKGEFISAADGQELLQIAFERDFTYAGIDRLGKREIITDAIDRHIQQIHRLATVDVRAIKDTGFTVVVDCINSSGAVSVPPLLESLGCKYITINGDISGTFAHNPEPLAEHLTDLSLAVIKNKADLGISVDPDVDRLAFMDEDGKYCGEEYTLVMVADWVLSQTPGATVSNLSSTIVLRQITEQHGQSYSASAVGEVNVVNKMRQTNAIIGGEGNGGIIYPTLHAGRDALVGIALLLTALARKEMTLSQYRAQFPNYIITKNKIPLTENLDADQLLKDIFDQYTDHERDNTDGVKIYFENGWAHLRKSNTEPILRLYAEAPTQEEADQIVSDIVASIQQMT